MPRAPHVLILVALALIVGPPAAEAQRPTNRDQSGTTDLREEGYPIRTGIPRVMPQAADLHDDDLVLGVVIGGEARAYPVNLMWKPENEVLNDRLGGAAITATW
jgi:hypothetical protein